MMISTRGRYALRVMIDLAENSSGALIPMKDVARRQRISLKYLEKLLPVLTKNGLVAAVHGKGGGYRLVRSPDEYRVGEILRLMEGDLAPVSCLCGDAKPCSMAPQCRTLPMWEEFYRQTNAFFDSVTLADLMHSRPEPEFMI